MGKYLFLIAVFLTGHLGGRELSLEDKVGQIFFGFVYAEEVDTPTQEFLERTHLGNIIYFEWANGLYCPQQVKALSLQLRETITATTGVPPLLAVDQEGGRVSHLYREFGSHPSPASLGLTMDLNAAYTSAYAMAQELAEVGVTMNLAPVVDLSESDGFIGSRAFGSKPELVVAMAEQFIKAHRDVGVATILKHFPGHGATRINSHYALPVIEKERAQLEAEDLVPFRQLAPVTGALMTGHLYVPALDPTVPATFSSAILTDLLRREWGYSGVVMSDSLVMRGLVENQKTFEDAVEGVTKAAIRAFQAGCDCLVVGGLEWGDAVVTPEQNASMLERVMGGFREAVLSGDISQERLDQSVERMIKFKKSPRNAVVPSR